jgi:hypothetical protein
MRFCADRLAGATSWGGSFLYLDYYLGLADCCYATEAEIYFSSGCDYSVGSVADSAEGCALGSVLDSSSDSYEDFAVGFCCCDNEEETVGGFYVDVVMILFGEGWRFASHLCFGCGCEKFAFHAGTHRVRCRDVNHPCDHLYLILSCHFFHACPDISGNGIDLASFEPFHKACAR